MNFPLTEILVLLFILAPMIQKWLDNRKQKEREAAGKTGADPLQPSGRQAEVPAESEDLSWEDAMRELESIFTGEPAEDRQPELKPEPEPVPVTVSDKRTMREPVSSRPNVHSRDPGPVSYSRGDAAPTMVVRGAPLSAEHLDRQFKKSAAAVMEEPLQTTEFEDTAVTEFNVIDRVKNPSKLRDYYVLKEILDEPVARKKRLHHHL